MSLENKELPQEVEKRSNGFEDGSSDKALLEEPSKIEKAKDDAAKLEGNKTHNGDNHELKPLKAKERNGDTADTIVILDDKGAKKEDVDKKDSSSEADLKSKRSFDAKCLVIGLIVLLLMVIAAVAVIFVHTFNDHVPGHFRFAHIFSDHMVLQATPAKPVVWGFASTSENNVTVKVVMRRMDGKGGDIVHEGIVQDKAAGQTWSVVLDPMPPTNRHSYEIIATIEDKAGVPEPKNQIRIRDVLFGDVWLCAGDENLEFPAMKIPNFSTRNYVFTAKNSKHNNHNKHKNKILNNHIRLFSLNPSQSDLPWFNVNNLKHQWSKLVRDISMQTPSICLHMAKHLQKRLNRTIGLVSAVYPHSSIEQWMPGGAPATGEDCQLTHEYRKAQIWNTMLHPLLDFPSRGMVWYQGLADAKHNPRSYNCSMHRLLHQWTSHHKRVFKHYPIAVIQLAPPDLSNSKYTYNYADLRWKQTNNYGSLPNNLHPSAIYIPTIDLVSSKKLQGANVSTANLVFESTNKNATSSNRVNGNNKNNVNNNNYIITNTGNSSKISKGSNSNNSNIGSNSSNGSNGSNGKVKVNNPTTTSSTHSQKHVTSVIATRLSNGILSSFYDVKGPLFDRVLPVGYRFKKGDDTPNGSDKRAEENSDKNNDNADSDEGNDDADSDEGNEVGDSDGDNKGKVRMLEIRFEGRNGEGLMKKNVTDAKAFEVCCSENQSLSCSFSFPKVSYAPGREWVEARMLVHQSDHSILIDVSSCTNHVVGVRYLWKDVPCGHLNCPLYSTASLPITPFLYLDLNEDQTFSDLVPFHQGSVSLM